MSDSSNPIIFKRRSKPSTRTRQSSAEPEIKDAGSDSPSTLATRLKTKTKRSQPKSRLSFGGGDDEEEGAEVFKVKKSNLSQKLSLGTHPSMTPLQSRDSPSRGPVYDQAYLQELKASTPNARPPPVHDDAQDVDMSIDIDASVTNLSLHDISGLDLPDTMIPAESSIRAAKERRERLRATGASVENDYISLSVVKRGDEPQGPHPESRLVREEDELGEGDDAQILIEYAEYTSAQDRIALGKKSRKLEASKRRDQMKEMIEDADEVDEETDEWEQEQIRRAGHASSGQEASRTKEPISQPPVLPTSTPLPVLSPALSRLNQQLAQLTMSHAENTSALNEIGRERAEVDNREVEMREMVEKAENKRAWFSEFKDWVEGVAAFLDEKYPLLEALEEEHCSLIQERSGMVKTRRSAEDEDDMCTFLGVVRPPEEEELDEFGRAIPKATAATRRAARLARRRRRHPDRPVNDFDETEGYSTDSSLPPSDLDAYSKALASLYERAAKILSDVQAEEFREPGKGRWSVWRERYSESYVGAWGGLGVVSVWEFWTRLEIVGWDMLKEPKSLDSFKWYEGLHEYSRPNGEDLGPDGDLVSSMISTVVIPRLCKLLECGVFDVYSDAECRRMSDLAEEIEASIDAGNTKFLALLKSVAGLFTTLSPISGLYTTDITDKPAPILIPQQSLPAQDC
ncbi:unnamed protein product [Mycena citricolor]|uniref:GC-rich sequence DNA-binding factor n=1 Tax=Mycena citricolor TaxID=2018698 RepID=A0AAD2K7X5_9AGAR|nr:unnamed protein product [Mycena citricolor]